MTYAEASKLRDEIKMKAGWDCVVPRGYGPDGYFARIFKTRMEPVDFYGRRHFRDYYAARMSQKRTLKKQLWGMPGPRSAIEMLIDQACGLSRKV